MANNIGESEDASSTPYRTSIEKDTPEMPASMILEMDENTMYAKVWRSVFTVVGAVVTLCWALNSAVNWREAGIKVELLRLETTPDGMEHARLERDKAMYESMTTRARQ